MIPLLVGASIVLLILVMKGQDTMNQALERLATEVAEVRDANESAIALITGLAQEIRDARGDTDRLNALADSLDSESKRLADAVSANTEQPEQPPVEEPQV